MTATGSRPKNTNFSIDQLQIDSTIYQLIKTSSQSSSAQKINSFLLPSLLNNSHPKKGE